MTWLCTVVSLARTFEIRFDSPDREDAEATVKRLFGFRIMPCNVGLSEAL
jgi:hypothetical protein